ncbi:DUF722 domain-containing protein [Lactovum odontotermitis]
MATRIDQLIKDFISGRLDTRIKLRRLELEARDYESAIGTKQRSTTAPQEALLIRIDEDSHLKRLQADKAIMSEWWKALPKMTQKIFNMRYSSGLPSWQIEEELSISNKTSYNRQREAKNLLAEVIRD